MPYRKPSLWDWIKLWPQAQVWRFCPRKLEIWWKRRQTKAAYEDLLHADVNNAAPRARRFHLLFSQLQRIDPEFPRNWSRP